MLLLQCLTLVFLLGIILQDLKYRLVNLILFLGLFAVLALQKFLTQSLSLFLEFFLLNILYIAILTATVFSYIFLKHRRTDLMQSFIGVGDLLLWVTLAVWFDPVRFVIFNSITFSFALGIHYLFKNYSLYGSKESVPLAGIQSFCLFLLFFYYSFLSVV